MPVPARASTRRRADGPATGVAVTCLTSRPGFFSNQTTATVGLAMAWRFQFTGEELVLNQAGPLRPSGGERSEDRIEVGFADGHEDELGLGHGSRRLGQRRRPEDGIDGVFGSEEGLGEDAAHLADPDQDDGLLHGPKSPAQGGAQVGREGSSRHATLRMAAPMVAGAVSERRRVVLKTAAPGPSLWTAVGR